MILKKELDVFTIGFVFKWRQFLEIGFGWYGFIFVFSKAILKWNDDGEK